MQPVGPQGGRRCPRQGTSGAERELQPTEAVAAEIGKRGPGGNQHREDRRDLPLSKLHRRWGAQGTAATRRHQLQVTEGYGPGQEQRV